MSDSLDALPLRQHKLLRISTDVPLFMRCSSNLSSSSSSTSNQDITPGTTPSTGIPPCFFHVLCMHDFESSDPAHLPFHKDEVLTIIKQEHSGWWAAMRLQGDRIGWIPSSFVLPLDGSKIVEYPDMTLALRPYENLNDPPLSAFHDPWVPVSEDCAALSSWLVTPTDLVLYNGLADDRARSHDCEPFISLQDDEQPSYMEDVCVPPNPESPPPYRVPRLYPLNPFPSEPGSPRLVIPASPDTALRHHPRPSGMNDQAPLLCLATPVSNSDEITPEVISDVEESPVVLKSFAISQDSTHSRHEANRQYLGLPTDFRSTGLDRSIDLTIWGPDQLAEQLCVLMHALYATVHQNDCLDWMAGHRSSEITGLQHYFDVHDYIASWVQRSILAYDDITRQTETLEFWVRVAEKCHSFRNFDSMCAIILALSGPSLYSLGSAWARCAHKRAFATLHNMLVDVESRFNRLVVIMDAAMGPSIPFIRGYLDHIKKLHVGLFDKPLHTESRHAIDGGSSAALRTMQLAAVSALLRHQSSPYEFRITESIRSFIDDVLQTID